MRIIAPAVVVVVDTIVVLILEDLVLKVEVGLPGAAVVLDVVSEGCTLHKGMVHLTVGQLGIVRLQVGEHLGGLVKSVRTALKNSILGDVRH